jgi:hypothetical protein
MPRDTLIQIRRGLSSEWIDQNPVLADGEFGFETDTNKLKIGNGNNSWKTLDYVGSSENIIKVLNNTGYALYKGQAVYISGFSSEENIPSIQLYIANDTISEQKFSGLVSAYSPDTEYCFINTFGILSGIDTTGSTITNISCGDETWQNGDVLYVSPYEHGKLTVVKPEKNIILVGIVLSANINGSILIRSFINPRFDQLNGININNPLNSNFLKYNNSSSSWTNSDQIDCGLI